MNRADTLWHRINDLPAFERAMVLANIYGAMQGRMSEGDLKQFEETTKHYEGVAAKGR